MPAPLLYEINTRVWLRELSERTGGLVTLDNVPDAEIERWRELGFTHIWLMGIWAIGPLARKEALLHWRNDWKKRIPSMESDVHGSPYAIQDYSVDPHLGSPLTLLLLRERLRMAGLKLILDFVPNHFGLDSTAPFQYPGRFVQSAPGAAPGTFPRMTRFGRRFFAHGRDPHFPPWSDTVQVDYRAHETQEAMSAILQTLAACSDGVRCDMAMLLLPDVFWKTWKDFPPSSSNPMEANFWSHAIAAFRQINPGAELIAEAYWGREEELQGCGFDFTYNKRVTDFIMARDFAGLQRFLLGSSPERLRKSIHFLENHDEARAAAALPLNLHRAAAALILTLPGMPLLHEGQLEGRRESSPIQMSRRANEPVDPRIRSFYERLLGVLTETKIRQGRAEILKPLRVSAVNPAIAIHWRGGEGVSHLVVVNLGSDFVRLELDLPIGAHSLAWTTTEESGADLRPTMEGVQVEAPPVSAQIWRFL